MSRLRRIAAVLALVAGATLSSGCGAVVARGRIIGAETAVAEATRAGADRKAVYQHTAAVLYLEKAREEESFARFGAAIRFGKKAQEFADNARLAAANAEPDRAEP
jgi:hypothetical protein